MTRDTARKIIAIANSAPCYHGEAERKEFFRLCSIATKTLQASKGGRHLRDVSWKNQHRVELPTVRANSRRLLPGTSCTATPVRGGMLIR